MCFHFGTTKGDVGDGESKTSGGAAAAWRWWKQAKQGNGGCLKLAAYHFAAAAAAAAHGCDTRQRLYSLQLRIFLSIFNETWKYRISHGA